MKSLGETINASPDNVEDGETFAMKVVVKAGSVKDWACYIGPTDWSDDEVLSRGDKIGKPDIYPFTYLMQRRLYRR